MMHSQKYQILFLIINTRQDGQQRKGQFFVVGGEKVLSEIQSICQLNAVKLHEVGYVPTPRRLLCILHIHLDMFTQ